MRTVINCILKIKNVITLAKNNIFWSSKKHLLAYTLPLLEFIETTKTRFWAAPGRTPQPPLEFELPQVETLSPPLDFEQPQVETFSPH